MSLTEGDSSGLAMGWDSDVSATPNWPGGDACVGHLSSGPHLVIEGAHHAVLFDSAQQLGQQLVPEVQIDESRTAQLGLPWLPRTQGAHGP